MPPCWPDCESNGAIAQAQGPLASGVQYRGHIASAQDENDFFYFDMPAVHTIEAWLRDILAGANYHLYLYNSARQQVGYSGQPNNEDEHILTGALPAGRYYVRVQRASGFSSTQPYSLRVVFR